MIPIIELGTVAQLMFASFAAGVLAGLGIVLVIARKNKTK